MNEGLLGSRIREYDPANILEQENVLRELLQHLVLASLSRPRLPPSRTLFFVVDTPRAGIGTISSGLSQGRYRPRLICCAMRFASKAPGRVVKCW